MMMPAARAAAATGAGGIPEVVLPSVNMTMTFAFEDIGSNSPAAGADRTVLCIVRRFVDDVDKSIGSGFHICERASCHAA